MSNIKNIILLLCFSFSFAAFANAEAINIDQVEKAFLEKGLSISIDKTERAKPEFEKKMLKFKKHFFTAAVHLDNKKWNQAEPELKKADKIFASPEVKTGMGIVLFAREEYEAASDLFNQSLNLHQTDLYETCDQTLFYTHWFLGLCNLNLFLPAKQSHVHFQNAKPYAKTSKEIDRLAAAKFAVFLNPFKKQTPKPDNSNDDIEALLQEKE